MHCCYAKFDFWLEVCASITWPHHAVHGLLKAGLLLTQVGIILTVAYAEGSNASVRGRTLLCSLFACNACFHNNIIATSRQWQLAGEVAPSATSDLPGPGHGGLAWLVHDMHVRLLDRGKDAS